LTAGWVDRKLLNMKAVYVEDELHRRLKLRAAARRVPLRAVLEDCVRRALADSTADAAEAQTAAITAAAAGGGAFDFLASPDEDIYSPLDGERID